MINNNNTSSHSYIHLCSKWNRRLFLHIAVFCNLNKQKQTPLTFNDCVVYPAGGHDVTWGRSTPKNNNMHVRVSASLHCNKLVPPHHHQTRPIHCDVLNQDTKKQAAVSRCASCKRIQTGVGVTRAFFFYCCIGNNSSTHWLKTAASLHSGRRNINSACCAFVFSAFLKPSDS